MSFTNINDNKGRFGILNGVGPDTTAELLEKSMSHKYFRREGTPGNYKYYYTEADYKAGKSSASEPKENSTIECQGKQYKKQSNGKYLEVSEHGLTKKEHEKEANKYKKQQEYGETSKVYSEVARRSDSTEEVKHKLASSKLNDKEYSKEELEGEGKRMDLKSNWDNMSLRERDKFLESFKKDRPDDYKLLNTSIVNLSANNFEAWSEKQQDLLSSYYMFEFID